MKKQMVMLGAVAGLLFCNACTSPRRDEPRRPEEPPKGCGCQSSENALDLRGTTEKSGDGL